MNATRFELNDLENPKNYPQGVLIQKKLKTTLNQTRNSESSSTYQEHVILYLIELSYFTLRIHSTKVQIRKLRITTNKNSRICHSTGYYI